MNQDLAEELDEEDVLAAEADLFGDSGAAEEMVAFFESNSHCESMREVIKELSTWLDNFIVESLKQSTPENNYFSEYTKSIFQSMINNFGMNSYFYADIDQQQQRIKRIEDGLINTMKLQDAIKVDSEDDHKKLDHKVSCFIDQVVRVLSLELTIQALSTEYLDTRDPEYMHHLRSSFNEIMEKSFLIAEPIFYEQLKQRRLKDQMVLVELLKFIDFRFEPRIEYYNATKAAWNKELELMWAFAKIEAEVKNLPHPRPSGLNYFNCNFCFCSKLRKDDDMVKLCFDNLIKLLALPSRNNSLETIGSQLKLLAKFREVELDSTTLTLLNSLLDQYLRHQTKSKLNDENISFILQILVNSNFEKLLPNTELEHHLIKTLKAYDNAMSIRGYETLQGFETERQASYALMLLNRMDVFTDDTVKALQGLSEDLCSNVSAAARCLLDKEPQLSNAQGPAKLAADFKILRNHAGNENGLKTAMLAVAFFFASPEAINYLLSNDFGTQGKSSTGLNKIIKPSNMPYFINGSQTLKNSEDPGFAKLKNEFLNLLIMAWDSENEEIKDLAKKLLFLFPDEIISKAFRYVTNCEEVNLVSLGMRTIRLFTLQDYQSFLSKFLLDHPEIKESFKVTEVYTKLGHLAEQDESFARKLYQFEESLQALGFKFKMTA